MTFAELSQYLDRMEATRSRKELVQTLAELYAKVSPDEIQPVTYLIQGRLAPFFEPIEIGMGEKLVLAAIAQSAGRPMPEVSKLYDTLGDLGLVAAEVSPTPGGEGPSITIVHSQLMEVASASGAGSVEKKRTIFASLLQALDAASRKHLVRMALGRLRLGIGDPTVLEALSFAKKGDRSLRPVLEGAYNRTSDLGLIARTFW
ncbi:MAG TPA: DNA ligase, partial [Candidatus Dormibacteraeota bacterium]|nr:DNA ligase [Candidatus Dormibacteraeota bacterium]